MLRSFLTSAFPSPWYLIAMTIQAGLLFVLLRFHDMHYSNRQLQLYALSGIALLSLLVWVAALRRRWAFLATPLSRIVSAAQGYVELHGTGLELAGNPLVAPLSGRPCLWYRYKVEQRSGDRWEHLESGVSEACFILNDGTGQCLVDPEGSEVITREHRTWEEGDKRCHEWQLLIKDRISVLGDFVTLRQSDELNAEQDISELLAEWKKDQPALLRRFDLDHNGEIDFKEWEWVRRAARNTIAKRHQEARAQDALNMVKVSSARLSMITNHEPEKLVRRFLWLAVFQLGVFLAAMGGIGWLKMVPH
jgi:hypothetical protein